MFGVSWPFNRTDLYSQLIGLKSMNPELKVHLAVGGYSMGTWPWESLTSSPSIMQAFAVNAASFLRTHGFDGLDLDWEFPGVSYRSQFSALCQALFEHFTEEAQTSGLPRLLLTAAVSGYKPQIEESYEVQVIEQ